MMLSRATTRQVPGAQPRRCAQALPTARSLLLKPTRLSTAAASAASAASNEGPSASGSNAAWPPAAPSAASTPPAEAAAAPSTSAAAKAENFEGDMLKPSVVNTPLVRAAAILGAVGAVAVSSQFMPARLSAFLHVSAYGVWLGTVLWNTFFVGFTMFKNMPRQTFGKVQSKLFPQYFTLTAGANLLALATLVVAGGTATAEGTRAVASLVVSLVAALANWLWLEPKCTGLMFERYDLENKGDDKTEEDKARIQALYKEFGKWHGISSLVNLVIFMVVAAHGWFLAGLVTLAV